MTMNFVEQVNGQGYHDYSGLPRLVLSNGDLQKFSRNIGGPENADPSKFAGGTLDQMNVLQAWRVWKGTVLQYDRDLLGMQMGQLLEAANHNAAEQMDLYADTTTDRFIHNDETSTVAFQEMNAASMPTAQKAPIYGSNQGFALRRFGVGLQWTEEYFRTQDMKSLAATMQAIITADSDLIAKRIRKAIFNSTNVDFYDFLQDKAILPIKALVNATGGSGGDGYILPPAPYNGVTFNSANHTHFMAPGTGNGDTITDAANTAWGTSTAANKQTNLNAMISNLREHQSDAKIEILVNWQDAVTYWGGAGGASTTITGFQHLERVQALAGTYRDKTSGPNYNPDDQFDALLGYFDDVPVYKKPWVPAGYIMAQIKNAPKPLVIRVHKVAAPGATTSGSMSLGSGDLRQVFSTSNWPLHAEAMVRDFEANVNCRWSMAVMKITATSYAKPAGL